MTEQEWLEALTDQWMHDRSLTPAFSPDLPPVSDCGWRVNLNAANFRSGRLPLERTKGPEYVEFYAVFGDREVTTRRPVSGLTWSVPATR